MLNNALFTVDYNEMVIVKDIDFYSLCEHHLLPFFGRCHIAYIPKGKVIGLSKIPRLVEVFARRLQIQERMTSQIAETIREKIQPLGVAVVIEATHLCMAMRGVEKQNSFAITSAMLGGFQNDARTRMEFLELIRRPDLQSRASQWHIPIPHRLPDGGDDRDALPARGGGPDRRGVGLHLPPARGAEEAEGLRVHQRPLRQDRRR